MTTSALTTTALTVAAAPLPAANMLAALPDTIGFARLHALVARGYRPSLGAARRDDGHVCIDFTHPRDSRKDPPPPITLWSDGILATSRVLWPAKYVPEENKNPPDWQKFILPGDGDRFENFASSVALPTIIDLYLKPFAAHARVFATRFMFASTLCTVLGFGAKLVVGSN